MRYPTGASDLWILIADPASHVKAPLFVNPVFEARGLDAFLVAMHVPVAELARVVPALALVGNLRAIGVTIPHKEAMAKLCHALGPAAQRIGAVNCVRVEPGGRLVGEMFDGVGFIGSARQAGMALKGRRALVLGAGGAGRAVAFALAEEGVARLSIFNRNRERAEVLAADVRRDFPALDVAAAGPDGRGHDFVTNCTSLGLHAGDPMPMDPATLEAGCDLIDIIAVRDTELMEAARAKGCRVVGGRPMVELQLEAQIAFVGARGLQDAHHPA